MITMTVPDIMLDHPAWLVGTNGVAYRAVRSGSAVWTVTCSSRCGQGRELHLDHHVGDGPVPLLDRIDPGGLAATDSVAEVLRSAGPVARLRNPDLWDAIGTSIVRQVIRAGQARKLYRTFCQGHGEAALFARLR